MENHVRSESDEERQNTRNQGLSGDLLDRPLISLFVQMGGGKKKENCQRMLWRKEKQRRLVIHFNIFYLSYRVVSPDWISLK